LSGGQPERVDIDEEVEPEPRVVVRPRRQRLRELEPVEPERTVRTARSTYFLSNLRPLLDHLAELPLGKADGARG